MNSAERQQLCKQQSNTISVTRIHTEHIFCIVSALKYTKLRIIEPCAIILQGVVWKKLHFSLFAFIVTTYISKRCYCCRI